MSKKESENGSIPTRSTSPERTSELTKKLLITEKALQHLIGFGMIKIDQIKAAGCCSPNGGTCCPNKGRMLSKLEGQVREAREALEGST